MILNWKDKVLPLVVFIILIILTSVVTLLVFYSTPYTSWQVLYIPFLGYFSFVFLTLLLLWLLRVIAPPTQGLYRKECSKNLTVWKLRQFLISFNLGFLFDTYIIPMNLRPFFFSLLGAKFGKWVMISGRIVEPEMILVGDFTQIGQDAIICGHYMESGNIFLRKTHIGSYVTIGAGAIVGAGAKIGDHAVVGAGAIVPPASIVPVKENVSMGTVWGEATHGGERSSC